MSYEVVRILEVDYLRVPYVRRGWCTGCANAANAIDKNFCEESEVVHEHGCIGSIFIHTTPEAIEKYETQAVIARLENEA